MRIMSGTRKRTKMSELMNPMHMNEPLSGVSGINLFCSRNQAKRRLQNKFTSIKSGFLSTFRYIGFIGTPYSLLIKLINVLNVLGCSKCAISQLLLWGIFDGFGRFLMYLRSTSKYIKSELFRVIIGDLWNTRMIKEWLHGLRL